jgi:hypothetical protein
MSNTSIQLKKSGITGNTPVDLQHGEVAINYADGKLYYKSSIDDIKYITNQDSFATMNVNNSLVLAATPTDTLSLTSSNDITILANTISKTITIGSNSVAGSYANAAFAQANAAYNLANTISGGTVDSTARDIANSAFIQANAAFTYANTMSPQDNVARDTANSAALYANSAFSQANAAFEKANTGSPLLKVGLADEFDAISNVISDVTQINFDSFTGFKLADLGAGNVKVSLASSFKTWQVDGQTDLVAHGEDTIKFATANGIVITTHPTPDPVKTITFDGLPIFNAANISYSQANVAFNQANAAFIQANTPSYVANSASLYANGAFIQANAAFIKANTEPTRLYNNGYEVALQPSGLLKTKNIEIDNTIQGGPYSRNTLYMGDTIKLETVDYEIQFKVNGYEWDLHADGSIRFPDGSLQNTAWTNVAVDNVARYVANASFIQANSSYDTANSAGSYANSSFVQANASFGAANSSAIYANGAFVQANSSSVYANGAFAQANAVFILANAISSGSTTTGSYANSAFDSANSASIYANSAFNTANSGATYANGSFAQSNSAYAQANSSSVYANSAFSYANGAYNQANSSSLYANGSFAQSNAAFGQANSAASYANGAFGTANSAASYANSAYSQSNSASLYANSAFIQANAAYQSQNTTGTYANSAYTQANGAFIQANGAFGTANSSSSYANGAFVQANASYGQANSAGLYANAAFLKANSANTLANSKAAVYTQDTAPTGINVDDIWIDSSSGIEYVNVRSNNATQWVEFGTTGTPLNGTGGLGFSEQTMYGVDAGTDVTIQQIGTGSINLSASNVNTTANLNAPFITVRNATFSSSEAAVKIIGSSTGAESLPVNSGYMLNVTGRDNLPSRIVNSAYGTGAYALVAGRAARGNIANPQAVQAGDVIARYSGNGHDGTGFATLGTGRIDIVATENHTPTSKGTRIEFSTVETGSNVFTEIASFNGKTVIFTGNVVSNNSITNTSYFSNIKINNGIIYPVKNASANTTQYVDYANGSLQLINLTGTTTIVHQNISPGRNYTVIAHNNSGVDCTVNLGVPSLNCTATRDKNGKYNAPANSIPIFAGTSASYQFITFGTDLANTYCVITPT